MAAHTALGYLLAVGLAGAARASTSAAALLGLALWVVCLNGGTLALNSAFDRDEGDIAYLRQPAAAAAAAWPRSASGSCWLGRSPRWRCRRAYRRAYAICFVLSRAVLGPAVPAQGGGRRRLAHQHVGLRHPDAVCAGWAATGLPLGSGAGTRPARASARSSPRCIRSPSSISSRRTPAAATGPWPCARDPAEASTSRSPRPRWRRLRSVRLGGRARGWAPGAPGWRWGLLALALLAWAAVLVPWRRAAEPVSSHGTISAACTSRSAAWAVTDVAVLLRLGHLTPLAGPGAARYTSALPTFPETAWIPRRSCTATTT